MLKNFKFQVINGEKSAFNNSVFGKRRKRTIEAILTSLYTNYDKENTKVILFRRLNLLTLRKLILILHLRKYFIAVFFFTFLKNISKHRNIKVYFHFKRFM